MKTKLLSGLLSAAVGLSVVGAVALTTMGCVAEVDYHDRYGHPYVHRTYHNEVVYQHEDGRWYAHRHNAWVNVEVRD